MKHVIYVKTLCGSKGRDDFASCVSEAADDDQLDTYYVRRVAATLVSYELTLTAIAH